MKPSVTKTKTIFSAGSISARLPKGLTMVELMAVVVIFGLAVTAVALRFGKSNQTEHLAKCQQKIADMIRTATSQAKVRYIPIKLTYDLKHSRIRTENINQYDISQPDAIEFELDNGIYIDQLYQGPDDCIIEGSVTLLVQPGGWLSSHAVVLRNSETMKVLFWRPGANSLIECEDTEHIPWGQI